MSLLQIRQRLETLLASQLGSYDLGNGSSTVATWVGNVTGPRPGTAVQGLELVLDPGDLEVVRQYGSEVLGNRIRADLVLWDEGPQLEQALTTVMATWPGTRSQPVSIPEGWGPLDWRRLELSLSEVLA